MKKIATITFHAAHNYGSNLQAYALQEYVKYICNYNCKYEIINLRTNKQKELYKSPFLKKDKKSIIKRIIFWGNKKVFNKKHELFENYINTNLNVTKEYNSLEELKKEEFDYDYYIAGSDQLWNLSAYDFDWSNYLEFVKNGKKISYAASFGPKAQKWNNEEKERVKSNLKKFDLISVREMGSFDNVKSLTNIEAEINVDPTMLLTKEQWKKLISDEAIRTGDYIFLYDIHGKKETFEIAKQISKELNMPIVIAKECARAHILYGFKKNYECGPIEFLNLLYNAKLILSSSFHGTVFSVLLNKPFLAINGNKDFRINNLLKKMSLEDRSVEKDNIEIKCKNVYNINFEKSEELLNKERNKAKDYLERALDIK